VCKGKRLHHAGACALASPGAPGAGLFADARVRLPPVGLEQSSCHVYHVIY
jgi:hypothetical protein